MRLAALVSFLLAVVLFAPATLGGKVLSASDQSLYQPPFVPPAGQTPANPLQYDAAYVFEPDALQVRAALRAGRLPTWTQAQSAGAPLLASQQSAPLFPLTWLGVIFPFFSALAWMAVLKLALATFGTALFGRRLGLGPPAALLAGITFGFGTYTIDWLGHPHVNAYILLPWMLVAAERLARSGSLRDAALLGGTTGLAWLSGQPESALLVSLATAAWFAYRTPSLRRAALAVAAGVAGLALAAIMLIPLVEALAHAAESSRARPPLPLRSALTLVAPEWWGRPDVAEVAGPSNFTERTLYVGVLPTLLAVAGLLARRPDGPQRFFAGLALVGVAVSWDTGPIASVAADLPGLSAINLTRALVLAAFGLALLAGLGLQRFLDGTAAERRRMLVAAAALAALPLVGTLVAHPGWLGDTGSAVSHLFRLQDTPTADGLAYAAVLRWTGVGLVGIAALAAVRRPALAWVAVAVVAADLLAMGAGYNSAISKAQAQPPATAALRTLQHQQGRVLGVGGLEPNTGSRWGLRDARGHEQPTLERTAALYNALVPGLLGAAPGTKLDPRGQRLLDVFGVRALLLPPDPNATGVLHSGPDGTVIANPSALPEASVVYDWQPSPDLKTSVALTTDRAVEQIRDQPAVETATTPSSDPAPATAATVITRSDTSVTIDADAKQPGRLVLLDTDYPGWKATVDDKGVPIAATNAAFRSVPIPAGRHTVRFHYAPASVRWGAIISLAALVALLICGLRGGRLVTPQS